ncbi:MAG: extracellular solute-binding protein [Proteobacteria bacterium]|nr:extracellular solute-binding protein [Pseudomonadota bacterium]
MGAWLGAILGMAVAWSGAARAQAVEIEYWQYTFTQRVEAIDELIKQFQMANPGIRVKHTHVPYDDFRVKIAAAIPAGQGPDVVQLFYGWLQDYLKAGLLQPLPADAFNPAEIEKEFFPIVQQMKLDGKYYALPTAVRSLALFWNKKLFEEAGLNPQNPPRTLDELIDMAKKLTKRSPAGDLLQAGIALDMGGQDHQWLREVLIRQFGGMPYSADKKTVAYANDAGAQALTWYTDLVTKHKVSQFGFLTDAQSAFKAGKAALTIDGSFRLGAFDGQRGLEYGVAELPAHQGVKSNFASYWVNGITPKATGAKRDAAVKFLKFITTPAAMELWLAKVGELPARVSVAEKDANKNNAKYGAFIRGLAYAYATDFVNESAQRKVMIDMVDQVVLKNTAPKQAVAMAAAEEQKVLDGFFKK